MKNLLLLLLVLPLFAAAKVPDENTIINQTMDVSSPYYYPNLILRYNVGDSTLTADDYHYLYYGYAYQDGYKPLNTNPDLDRMLMMASTLTPENPLRESVENLLSAAIEAKERDPFSPTILNVLAYCYGALGDTVQERAYYRRTQNVIRTIEESGDALTQKTPQHILMFGHALDVLASHELEHGKSRVISRTVEYVPLLMPKKTEEGKIRGYYFDFGRIYWNKPEGYTYKRDRTWQFNNLKPRTYK
ncbi:MAG: DUF4919 domain-containing protein [Alistipes sp.]